MSALARRRERGAGTGALAWAVRLARPRRGRFAWSVALGAGATLAGAALLATSGQLISRAALRPDVLSLLVVIVAVRFFGMSRALLRYGERLVSHDLAFRVLADLRTRCWRRLAPLVPGELRGVRGGELLSRFVADVDTLQHLYLRALAPPLAAVVVIVATAVAAAFVLPAAGVALAAMLLLSAIAVPALTARAADGAARRQSHARARLTSELVEAIEGAPELAVAGRGPERLERIAAADARLAAVARGDARAGATAAGLGTLLAGLGAVAVLVAAIPAVHDGRVDGVLLAALALLALAAFEGVAPLGAAARHVRACADAAARLRDLTERQPAIGDPVDPVALAPGGALAFERVSVDGVLDDVTLWLAPGERVVLVGPSGAGKTTIARLAARMLDPSAGRVTIGGVDVRDAAQDDVRRVVLASPQDARLFTTTLRENVRLARPGATDAEIEAALGAAGLRRWRRRLAHGLDTLVGEDGARLSGGERQRVLLARALLSDARLLVLDEPTAHLDRATAKAVMRDLDTAAGDRGVLVITHDPAVVARADRVLELRDGQISDWKPGRSAIATPVPRTVSQAVRAA